MERINDKLLSELSAVAQTNERKRKNFNIHKQLDDPMQRLLNAMEPGTYVTPHKHQDPDKRELFLVMKGRMLLVEFDELGNIRDHEVLDATLGQFAAEIPARTYHTIISLKTGSVALEIKDGPYVQASDKDFATWAPKEGEPGEKDYIQKILDELGIEF